MSKPNYSTQGDPQGDPSIKNSMEPNENKPNKSSKPEDKEQFKSPIYPHTPVKVYIDAKVSKSDIAKDFKDVSIIYMWFNKIAGKVYIGSAVNGSRRLATYYQPSILRKNSLIYRNILKYGHDNFSVIILDICGNTSQVSKAHILEKEKLYIDWALKTYGLGVLNMLNVPGSSLGYKHTEESLLKMSECYEVCIKKGEKNPMYNKAKSEAFLALQVKGESNPRFGKPISEEELEKRKKKIYLYDKNYFFINCYESMGSAEKDLQIAAKTIRKYLDKDIAYKNLYFYSKLQ